MDKRFDINLQHFAGSDTGVSFEELLKKYADGDGGIPVDAIGRAASAIASAVGRSFVDRKRYNDRLEEIEALKSGKADAENRLTAAEVWQERYRTEHEAFEKHRAEANARVRLSAVKDAYRKLLTEVNIDPKRHDVILRATNFDDKRLDAGGGLEGADALKKAIEAEWADFKLTEGRKGIDMRMPPEGGARRMTRGEIDRIEDAGERQRAIAENHELYGF